LRLALGGGGSVPLGLMFEAFFDRVLVRSRECSENELTRVRVARVNGEIVALGDNFNDGLDVAEVDFWVDTLCIEVESEVDEVDVSGAFAVTEEAALDTVGTAEDPEFRRGNTGAYSNNSYSVDISEAEG
jgi:hypothetical protein